MERKSLLPLAALGAISSPALGWLLTKQTKKLNKKALDYFVRFQTSKQVYPPLSLDVNYHPFLFPRGMSYGQSSPTIRSHPIPCKHGEKIAPAFGSPGSDFLPCPWMAPHKSKHLASQFAGGRKWQNISSNLKKQPPAHVRYSLPVAH